MAAFTEWQTCKPQRVLKHCLPTSHFFWKTASPYLEDSVERGAWIIRGSRRRVNVFTGRQNPLLFLIFIKDTDSRQRESCICVSYWEWHMSESCADSLQTECIGPAFFVTGTYIFCGRCWKPQQKYRLQTDPKVAHALTEVLDGFVVFPGPLPTSSIKESFYDITGMTSIYVTSWPINNVD